VVHHGPVSDASAAKRALRERIRAARRDRGPAERASAADAIAEHGGYLLRSLSEGLPLLTAAYLSMATEPGTGPLIARAHAEHNAVWVPRVHDDDLHWVSYRPGTQVRSGRFGIPEPEGTAIRAQDLIGLDVMFIPGLAVDERGHRLGQGGGYYDRMLGGFPPHEEGGPLLVIVLFDDEIVTDVPVDEHDCRVDMALTPEGLLNLA
jgi:5-formyltetrahydrofolate cyclo-ligase